MTRCAKCGLSVTDGVVVCPDCGASCLGETPRLPTGFEWSSRAQWLGYPLVHVAFGSNAAGRVHTARGIVAIGYRAIGGVGIGIVATGFFAFGVLAFGLVSAGVVAIGLLAAVGVNAIAPIALGVVAFGFIAGGVQPIGVKILSSVGRQ